MRANSTPRQLLAGLLKGIPPPRPLWLPIVFSLGARTENLPLAAFLENATKISSSLRQIHGHVHSDGIACYFDPYLEAEALGGSIEWNAETQRPSLGWPGRAAMGELPGNLRSPEEAMKRGRVGVAVEVIRRLRSLVGDGSLLTAVVAGPFTLAARLTLLEHEATLNFDDLPEAALEAATSMMTQLSSAFAEAGANVIFIQESVLPRLTEENCEGWASSLAPAQNIIRFYQAVPVLLLTNSGAFAENSELIFHQHWDCVVCEPLDSRPVPFQADSDASDVMRGLALPTEALQPDKDDRELDRVLSDAMSESRLSIVTTASDIPEGVEMRRLIRISEQVRTQPNRCSKD